MVFGGAIRAADAFVTLSVESLLRKQLSMEEIQLKKFASRVIKIGKTVAAIGTIIGAGLALATKRAGDLVEAINAVDVVFGTASKSVKAFSDNLFKTLKRSRVATLEMAGRFGGFLTGAGFDEGEAANITKRVQQRVVDIGSLFNIDEAEAARRVLSGMSGEIEPLRRLGVNLRQVAVDNELLAMGIKGGFQAATEQQRIMARLDIIMRQTSKADEDAIRTKNSFANQLKELSGTFDEFLINVGTNFQTVGVDVIGILKAMINGLGDLIAVLTPLLKILIKVGAAFVKGFGAPLRAMLASLKQVVLLANPLFVVLGRILGLVGGAGGLVLGFYALAKAIQAAAFAGRELRMFLFGVGRASTVIGTLAGQFSLVAVAIGAVVSVLKAAKEEIKRLRAVTQEKVAAAVARGFRGAEGIKTAVRNAFKFSPTSGKNRPFKNRELNPDEERVARAALDEFKKFNLFKFTFNKSPQIKTLEKDIEAAAGRFRARTGGEQAGVRARAAEKELARIQAMQAGGLHTQGFMGTNILSLLPRMLTMSSEDNPVVLKLEEIRALIEKAENDAVARLNAGLQEN